MRQRALDIGILDQHSNQKSSAFCIVEYCTTCCPVGRKFERLDSHQPILAAMLALKCSRIPTVVQQLDAWEPSNLP